MLKVERMAEWSRTRTIGLLAVLGVALSIGPVADSASAAKPKYVSVKQMVIQISPTIIAALNSNQISLTASAPATILTGANTTLTVPTKGRLAIRGKTLLRSSLLSKGGFGFFIDQPSALPTTVNPTRSVVKGSRGTTSASVDGGFSNPTTIPAFDLKSLKLSGKTLTGNAVISTKLGKFLADNVAVTALAAGQTFGTFVVK